MKPEGGRELFIKERADELFKLWLRRTALWGALIFILLCVQDYVSSPGNFRLFFFYRMVIALVLSAVSVLSGKFDRKNIVFHRILAFTAIIASAFTIELMILRLGGHNSTYYAGQIILAIVIIGFIPANFFFHIVSASLIYAVYLIPIITFDTITQLRPFLSANIFIIAALMSMLLLRYLSWGSLVHESGLKYDMSEDIEKHNLTESALRESAASLSRAQQIAHIGDWEWELATNKVHWSDELFRIYGYEPHEVAPDYGLVVNAMHPDSRNEFLGAIDAALKGERPFEMDYKFFRNDGSEAVLHTIGQVLYDSGGNPERMLGTVQDITEHKRAEDKLRESEEKFRTIFDNANEGVLIADIATKKFFEANRSICEMLGYTKEEITNLSVNDIHPEKDLPHVLEEFEKQARGEKKIAKGLPVMRKDGGIFYADICAASITLGGKHYAVGIFHDITEQRRTEDALRSSNEFIKNILDTVDEGFIVVDRDFRIISANSAYCSQTGRPFADIIGKHCHEISHQSQRPCYEQGEECAVQHSFEKGEPHVCLHRHISKNGDTLYVETKSFPLKDAAGNVTSAIEVINNITVKHLLEEQILRTQKLEAVGLLAGGIAHDFNNLLQGIFGNISLAKIYSAADGKAFQMLEEAEKALNLSRNLTKQLLTFSKGGEPVKKVFSVTSIIRDSVKFALSGSNVDYRFSIDDALRPVEADEGQLSQVIQNIVLNAGEAMPEGGTIRISVRNILIDKNNILSLGVGKYVLIEIEDSGVGISEHHIQKIFDPYFTTKQKGSGLGLATSYSIIKRHGGALEVKSEPGIGTTFFIYLPASDEKLSLKETGREALSTGKGKILVMDDEKMILTVAESMLEALGYDTEVANNGEQALEKYSAALASGKPFDAVILDLTVRGGIGGRDTIVKMIEIDPEVRAIVSSGFSDDPILSNYENYGFKATLSKPYKMEELGRTLQIAITGSN
jgi:PAS domain S-box-containing protein